MVKKKLVEELIKDGVKLLHELDRRDLPVESMFWIHMPEEDYWRLVIGSPLVAEQGGAAAYQRLGELLRGIELAGVTLEDISLLDPGSEQYRSLLSQASQSSRLAAGAEWIEFEDAIFYRWTRASVKGNVDCGVSCEELGEIWEAERKTSNQPALLISLTGKVITLRFHPRHGALPGIENIKRAFSIALHKSRRDCNIRWLA